MKGLWETFYKEKPRLAVTYAAGRWWSVVVAAGQLWSAVVDGGRRWPAVAGGGRRWSAVDLNCCLNKEFYKSEVGRDRYNY